MRHCRRNDTGLTLVEMLIVVAIFVILAAIAVPSYVRNGFSLTSRINLAGQEYYTLLRAAQVYATANNVETAVVYVVTPTDPTNDNAIVDSFTDTVVPVVRTMLIARRLSQEELLAIDETLIGQGPLFVPLAGPDGIFRNLPVGMCLLPDLFAMDPNTGESRTGLQAVRMYDLNAGDLYTFSTDTSGNFIENESYDPGGTGSANTFAAHRFRVEGAFWTTDTTAAQRALVRVGRLPNTLLDDRFSADPADPSVAEVLEDMDLVYNDAIPLDAYPYIVDATRTPEQLAGDRSFHPRRNTLEIDRQVEIFFSTGRIKVLE